MKIHSQKVEEQILVENIVRSMSSKFSYIVYAIEESNNSAKLSINELHGSFLVHD